MLTVEMPPRMRPSSKKGRFRKRTIKDEVLYSPQKIRHILFRPLSEKASDAVKAGFRKLTNYLSAHLPTYGAETPPAEKPKTKRAATVLSVNSYAFE